MNLRQIGTRILGLFCSLHECRDGPMRGETLVLTEHDRATAWIEIRGEVGRYVRDRKGRLAWQRR